LLSIEIVVVVVVIDVLKGNWVVFRLHVQKGKGASATNGSVDTI
jgi:hypothetical protein